MAHYSGGCQTYRNNDYTKKICDYLVKKYSKKIISCFFNEQHKFVEPSINWRFAHNDLNQYTMSDF